MAIATGAVTQQHRCSVSGMSGGGERRSLYARYRPPGWLEIIARNVPPRRGSRSDCHHLRVTLCTRGVLAEPALESGEG